MRIHGNSARHQRERQDEIMRIDGNSGNTYN